MSIRPPSSSGTSGVGCAVTKAAAQAITHNSVTPVVFDTERWDSGGFHSTVTENTKVIVPVGQAGVYDLSAGIEWAANATSIRICAIHVNGIGVSSSSETAASAGTHSQAVSAIGIQLAESDYVQLIVYQFSGGDLNIAKSANYSPELRVVKRGNV